MRLKYCVVWWVRLKKNLKWHILWGLSETIQKSCEMGRDHSNLKLKDIAISRWGHQYSALVYKNGKESQVQVLCSYSCINNPAYIA